MKKIAQFVFYGKNSSLNNPKDLDLWKYNLLSKYGSVSHLGIQGDPGTIFYLNNSNDNEISIGATGVYELDLEGLGYITALKFDSDILYDKYKNNTNPNHRLIVDIVYEEG